jgi:hypothetical protein
MRGDEARLGSRIWDSDASRQILRLPVTISRPDRHALIGVAAAPVGGWLVGNSQPLPVGPDAHHTEFNHPTR